MNTFFNDDEPNLLDDQNDRNWTGRIVLFAILIRFVAAIFWQRHCDNRDLELIFGESILNWDFATRIATGEFMIARSNGDEHRTMIPLGPLYPLSLTPFAALGSVFAARVMGCVFGGFSVWIIMHWVRMISGKLEARFAGIIASLYCGAVGMSIFILHEAIATPLFLLSCWFLWKGCQLLYAPAEREASKTHLAVVILSSATCFALACLANPLWELWMLVAFPFIAFSSKSAKRFTWRKFLAHVAIFLFGFCVAMSPWWIRNYAITGKFVPADLTVGARLYAGLHESADGGVNEYTWYWSKSSSQILDNEARRKTPSIDGPWEYRSDYRLRQEAIKWAIENPYQSIRLALPKFVRTWSLAPSTREFANEFILIWEGSTYCIVMLLSFTGVVMAFGNRQLLVERLWLVMPCIYIVFIHLVLPGGVRYRLPATLILCGLAGIGLFDLLSKSSYAKYVQYANNRFTS
jgi:hypothetical protein